MVCRGQPRGVAMSENAEGAKVLATAQFAELMYLHFVLKES